MKKTLILTTALTGFAFAAVAEGEVTVMSWGGAYGKSQDEAYNKPFAAETGDQCNHGRCRQPGNPDQGAGRGGQRHDRCGGRRVFRRRSAFATKGFWKRSTLRCCQRHPTARRPSEDFIEGALTDCAVASIVWSTRSSYNTEANATAPDSIDDFFNLADFPGKRGLRKGAKINLEMALMARRRSGQRSL